MNNLLMYAGTGLKLGLANTMDKNIKKVQIAYKIKTVNPVFIFGMMPLIAQLVRAISKEEVESSYVPFSRREPFSGEDWLGIADEMGGVIPVNIYMVNEGQFLTDGDVALVIETVDERYAWMAEHISTALEDHMKRMLELSEQALQMCFAIRDLVVRDSDREGTDLTKIFLLPPEKGMSIDDMQIKAALYKLVCPLESSPISVKYIVDNYLPAKIHPNAGMSASLKSQTGSSIEERLATLLNDSANRHLNLYIDSQDDVTAFALLTKMKDTLNARHAPLVICIKDGDILSRAKSWMNNLKELVGLEQNSLGLEYPEKQFGLALKISSAKELTAFGDEMKKAGYTIDGYSFMVPMDSVYQSTVSTEKVSSFFTEQWDEKYLQNKPPLAYQVGATTEPYSFTDILKRLIAQIDAQRPHDFKEKDEYFPGRYSGWWLKSFVLEKD